MKATKRCRPGRRLGRKHAAWFLLRRPALLAALGLAGWAPAGAAAFPPTLGLAAAVQAKAVPAIEGVPRSSDGRHKPRNTG